MTAKRKGIIKDTPKEISQQSRFMANFFSKGRPLQDISNTHLSYEESKGISQASGPVQKRKAIEIEEKEIRSSTPLKQIKSKVNNPGHRLAFFQNQEHWAIDDDEKVLNKSNEDQTVTQEIEKLISNPPQFDDTQLQQPQHWQKVAYTTESLIKAVINMLNSYSPQPYFDVLNYIQIQQSITQFSLFAIEKLSEGEKGIQTLLEFMSKKRNRLPNNITVDKDSIKQNPKHRIRLSGIYLMFGVGNDGDIEWMYVGKSNDIHRRIYEHTIYIEEIWPPAELTEKLRYRLGKRSAQVNFVLLADTSKNDLDLLDRYNAALEPFFCALFGLYRMKKEYLAERAKWNLPRIKVIGANMNACLDGLERRHNSRPVNANLEDAQRFSSAAWLSYNKIFALFKFRQECQNVKREIPRFVPLVNQTTVDTAKEWWKTCRKLVDTIRRDLFISGDFIMTIKKKTVDRDSWLISNFMELTISKPVCQQLQIQDASQSFFLKLLWDNCSKDEIMPCLSEKKRHKFRGIKLFAYRSDDHDRSQPVPIQFIGDIDETRKFSDLQDLFFRWITEVDQDESTRRLQNYEKINNEIYDVPLNCSSYMSMVYKLLHGTCKVTEDKKLDNSRYKFNLRIPEPKEGVDCLTLRNDDILTLGYPEDRPDKFKVCIKVNFSSPFPIYRYMTMVQPDRTIFSTIGIDVLAADLTWKPIKVQFAPQKSFDNNVLGLHIKELIQDTYHVHCKQYGIVSRNIELFDESIFWKSKIVPIPYDRLGEPNFFRATVKTVDQQGRPKIRFYYTNQDRKTCSKTYLIPPEIVNSFWMNVIPQQIACKIDSWQRNDCRLLICSATDGVSSQWIDCTAITPFKQDFVDFLNEFYETPGRPGGVTFVFDRSEAISSKTNNDQKAETSKPSVRSSESGYSRNSDVLFSSSIIDLCSDSDREGQNTEQEDHFKTPEKRMSRYPQRNSARKSSKQSPYVYHLLSDEFSE